MLIFSASFLVYRERLYFSHVGLHYHIAKFTRSELSLLLPYSECNVHMYAGFTISAIGPGFHHIGNRPFHLVGVTYELCST